MSTLNLPDNLRKFTRDEFYTMVDAGIFDDDYEIALIDGTIVAEAAPIGGEHGWAVCNLNKALVQCVLGTEYYVHVHGGISLPGDRVLQPDFAIYKRTPERERQNPTADQIILVVEVSDTSLRKDLTDKMQLYAEAGVPTYWVVDVRHKQVTVYTRPDEGVYAAIEQFDVDKELEVCGRRFAVSDIF